MIEQQGLFKKYFVGRDGFHWWIGQIVDETTWRGNLPGVSVANNSGIPGFGERYKVVSLDITLQMLFNCQMNNFHGQQ